MAPIAQFQPVELNKCNRSCEKTQEYYQRIKSANRIGAMQSKNTKPFFGVVANHGRKDNRPVIILQPHENTYTIITWRIGRRRPV